MKKLLLSLAFLTPFLTFGGESKSLCTTGEIVVFSCPTKAGKQVSVCSKGNVVQYRFGRPGKLELEYPKIGEFKSSSFEYSHYFRPAVDRSSLQFETGEASYTVFDEYEDSRSSSGVFVRLKKTRRDLSIHCVAKSTGDWNAIEGKVDCADEPLNTCQ